jgi:DNA-binding PadR family transcriptional regulator
MAKREPVDPIPLTPAVFHVLLALDDGARHGYAIMQAVETSAGTIMGPGTIYGTLQRLTEVGLVQGVAAPRGEVAERRRYYRLTAAGRAALRTEAARIASLAELLRSRDLLPRPSEGG